MFVSNARNAIAASFASVARFDDGEEKPAVQIILRTPPV
jgi:hypothetical protein